MRPAAAGPGKADSTGARATGDVLRHGVRNGHAVGARRQIRRERQPRRVTRRGPRAATRLADEVEEVGLLGAAELAVARGGAIAAGRHAGGRHRPAVDLRHHLLHGRVVIALVDAVAQVFLRPHHAAFHIDEGRRGAACQRLQILGLQLTPEIKDLIARREQDHEVAVLGTDAARRVAVDLRHHALHGRRVIASVHAIADVFLRPHHFAFAIDARHARGASEAGLVLGFQLVTEFERVSAAGKQHIHRARDSAQAHGARANSGGGRGPRWRHAPGPIRTRTSNSRSKQHHSNHGMKAHWSVS